MKRVKVECILFGLNIVQAAVLCVMVILGDDIWASDKTPNALHHQTLSNSTNVTN